MQLEPVTGNTPEERLAELSLELPPVPAHVTPLV